MFDKSLVEISGRADSVFFEEDADSVDDSHPPIVEIRANAIATSRISTIPGDA